ncbi:MAG: DUF2304 domain-containing protein [Eubacteriales bacterium]|nr:DUF2304 domain-containing protein [Eubacteriales bacterium]
MSLRIRLFIAFILVIALYVVINMVRKRVLELKYVLLWIACDVILLFIDAFPIVMHYIANFFGIQSMMNMMFFFGFLFSLVIMFSLTVSLSAMTVRVRKLSQMIALREYENMNKLMNEKEEKKQAEE